jgi:hypothetical protein
MPARVGQATVGMPIRATGTAESVTASDRSFRSRCRTGPASHAAEAAGKRENPNEVTADPT